MLERTLTKEQFTLDQEIYVDRGQVLPSVYLSR